MFGGGVRLIRLGFKLCCWGCGVPGLGLEAHGGVGGMVREFSV